MEPVKQNSDVTIHVEQKTFHVNKTILELWSKVFKQMFESGMKESQSSEVTLHGESATEFDQVLKKLYPPCTFPITLENVDIFLKYADKYQMDELKEQCENFLMTQNPRIESAVLADVYLLPKLQERCLPWLSENLSDVIESKDFEILKKKTLKRVLEEVNTQRVLRLKSDTASRDSLKTFFDSLPDTLYTAIPTCEKRCDSIAKNKLIEFLSLQKKSLAEQSLKDDHSSG